MQQHAGLDDAEAYGTLNMGAGFALFVPAADAQRTVEAARGCGIEAWVAGHLEDGPKRLIVEPLGFEYGDDVVKLVVSRCTESESGGRMIDAILTNTMLPDISREFLTRMMEGQAIERVQVGVADGGFTYQF